MKSFFCLVAVAVALAQGCDTLPTVKEQPKAANSSKSEAAKTSPALESTATKIVKPVRPADVAPGQCRETIKALQDELDAAGQ